MTGSENEETASRNLADRQSLAAWITGCVMIVASILPVTLSQGVSAEKTFAVGALFSILVVAFLFLVRPRLGSLFEFRGAVNVFLVYLTVSVLTSHALANESKGPLTYLYNAFLKLLQQIPKVAGIEEATIEKFFTASVALITISLIVSLAFESYKGLVVPLAIVLANGLLPFNQLSFELALGFAIWIAGYWLIQSEVLYLPRYIEERMRLSKGQKDLLLQLRKAPLTIRKAVFILGGRPNIDVDNLPESLQKEMTALASTGLVEFDPETRRFFPTPELEDSHTAPGVLEVVRGASNLCAILIIVPCVVYFLLPIDFIPEGLIPPPFTPFGYVDDVVLLSLGSLPLLSKYKETTNFILRGFRTKQKAARKDRRSVLAKSSGDAVVK